MKKPQMEIEKVVVFGKPYIVAGNKDNYGIAVETDCVKWRIEAALDALDGTPDIEKAWDFLCDAMREINVAEKVNRTPKLQTCPDNWEEFCNVTPDESR